MFLRRIYDENLAAATYLIGCQKTGEAIVIDPERDIDRYRAIAEQEDLRITAVTETHIHADFLSGSREIAEQCGATVYLSGEGGPDWSYSWLDKKSGGGSYSHVLLKDGAVFSIGNIEFKVVHTPGHTPEHIAFLITDRGSGASEPMGIASGDFLFVGDMGRPDLLESAAGQKGAAENSAHTLFKSVGKLNQIPEFVQVWPAHGAGSACGKALGAVPISTIGYERRFNPALLHAKEELDFVNYILAGQPEPPLYFARMKRENKEGPKALGALPEPRQMSLAELKDLDTQSAVLIDTRSWKEFRQGHIPGSFFHPFNRSFVTNIGAMVGEDPEIFVVAQSEIVPEIVRNLVRIGLDKVRGYFDPSIISTYANSGGKLAQIKEDAPQNLLAAIQTQKLKVLDVRKLSEFIEEHIEGARQIAHTRLAAQLDTVSRDTPLAVHCLGGTRSAYACALLSRAGFKVINMQGGINQWKQDGCPVVK